MSFFIRNKAETYIEVTLNNQRVTLNTRETKGPFEDSEKSPDLMAKLREKMVDIFKAQPAPLEVYTKNKETDSEAIADEDEEHIKQEDE